MLPLLAMPFQKIVVMIPVFLLVLMACAVSNFASGKMKRESGALQKKSSKKCGSSLESNGKAKAKSRSKKNN